MLRVIETEVQSNRAVYVQELGTVIFIRDGKLWATPAHEDGHFDIDDEPLAVSRINGADFCPGHHATAILVLEF